MKLCFYLTMLCKAFNFILRDNLLRSEISTKNNKLHFKKSNPKVCIICTLVLKGYSIFICKKGDKCRIVESM